MSVLEFNVYAGFWCRKQDFRDKFIKHLMTRPWSPVQVMQWSKLNSKKQGTWSEKTTNSEDPTRKVLNLARQGVMPNSERNWRHGPTCRRGKHPGRKGTDVEQRRPRAGPGWAQAGRPSPIQGPFAPSTTRNWPLEHQNVLQNHVFGCNIWFYCNQCINGLRYLDVMATKNVGCVCWNSRCNWSVLMPQWKWWLPLWVPIAIVIVSI
jgi:hypothetical protein